MGFIDKTDRVIDMVLTDEGRRQLASGELEFYEYAFFDGGIDYDPVIVGSGSLSEDDLLSAIRDQIEATLSLEVMPGLSLKRSRDDLQVLNLGQPLYTMRQGKEDQPANPNAPDILTASDQVTERRVEETRVTRDQLGREVDRVGPFFRGNEVLKSTVLTLDLAVLDGLPSSEGFHLTVLASGSDGLERAPLRIDLDEQLSFGPDLIVSLDDEPSRDDPDRRSEMIKHVRPR